MAVHDDPATLDLVRTQKASMLRDTLALVAHRLYPPEPRGGGASSRSSSSSAAEAAEAAAAARSGYEALLVNG